MRQLKKDLILNFAPTGVKPTKDWTPHVPISPDEIIEQVHEAYETGITVVHLHARDPGTEVPSCDKNIYAKILSGVRKHCPDLVLGVTTTGRAFPDFERRSQVLELKPDMASLTLSSLNFLKDSHTNDPEMIQKLLDKMNDFGVHPELEAFDNGMINYGKYLITKEIIRPPFYWNLLFGNIATAQPDMMSIGLAINNLPLDSKYSLAGLGASQLTVAMHAVASGLGVRIGLEDNVYFDNKKEVFATNIGLIKRIHKLADIFERKILKPKDFGDLGFYNSKK